MGSGRSRLTSKMVFFAPVVLDDKTQKLDAVLVRREGAEELLRGGLEVQNVLGDDPCGRHGASAAASSVLPRWSGGGAARGVVSAGAAIT